MEKVFFEGLVLASTSSARRALMTSAGLEFRALSPEVEEHLSRESAGAPQAMSLARQKAEALQGRFPLAIIVGADQVLEFEGESFGKPGDAAEARAQLGRLNGREHALITGLAVLAPGRTPIVEQELTRMKMRELSEDELDAYVASGEWQGCAGGYRVESLGMALFERIEGDYTNVLGLPMPRLLGQLRSLGVPLFGVRR